MGIDKLQLVKVTKDQHFQKKERLYWMNTTFDYRLGILEQMKREFCGNDYREGIVRSFRKVSLENKNLKSHVKKSEKQEYA